VSLALLLPDMPARRGNHLPPMDLVLVAAVTALFSLGLVMVTSASMPVAERLGVGTFHFAIRQSIYLGLGLLLGVMVLRVRMAIWERGSLACILFAILLLLAVRKSMAAAAGSIWSSSACRSRSLPSCSR
jgi:cell division protein FtsW